MTEMIPQEKIAAVTRGRAVSTLRLDDTDHKLDHGGTPSEPS